MLTLHNARQARGRAVQPAVARATGPLAKRLEVRRLSLRLVRRLFPVLAAAGPAFALAACTYGGQIDRPYTQKATWFSYVNGDDIRTRCANIDDHWEVRLIYNADYERQVRTYDLVPDGSGRADVTARASSPDTGNLLDFELRDPLSPWRWDRSQTRLSPTARARADSALAAAGVYDRAPAGIRLKSWGSYWVSIACRDGRIAFNAWSYPSTRYAGPRLREIVQPLDDTGVAFLGPVPPSFEDQIYRPKSGAGQVDFQLETGDNGLAGTFTPF